MRDVIYGRSLTKHDDRTPYDDDTVDEVSGNPQIFGALVINRKEVSRGDADDGRGEGDCGCDDDEEGGIVLAVLFAEVLKN